MPHTTVPLHILAWPKASAIGAREGVNEIDVFSLGYSTVRQSRLICSPTNGVDEAVLPVVVRRLTVPGKVGEPGLAGSRAVVFSRMPCGARCVYEHTMQNLDEDTSDIWDDVRKGRIDEPASLVKIWTSACPKTATTRSCDGNSNSLA